MEKKRRSARSNRKFSALNCEDVCATAELCGTRMESPFSENCVPAAQDARILAGGAVLLSWLRLSRNLRKGTKARRAPA